jgi:hypothetical protein
MSGYTNYHYIEARFLLPRVVAHAKLARFSFTAITRSTFRILLSQINSGMTLHESAPNTSQRHMEVTGKILPVTGHEGPEVEQRVGSTYS